MPDQDNKKMSLLGGLIFEGMNETIKAFQSLSRDAQIDTVNKTAEDMKGKLTQIQTTTEQIRSAHIRENLSLIVNDLRRELDNIIDQAPKDPLGSFVHLLFLPMSLIFRGTELIWGSLYGWLLNMFYPTGPVSYEEARMNAIEFFTLTGDFNAIATIFDILGDIQVLGTKLPGRAVGNFIRNISWTFGLGWMTWVVMSPVLRVSIAEPMEAEMRRITRPKAWTETDIRELYEFGIDKLEDHIEHLAEQGYSDDKIEKLLEISRKRVLREEARRFVTDMAAAYVKGYITDDELMKAIELAYWTEDERQFRYWEERTRRESEIIDLRIDEIERAFKTEKIDENEARARLSEFIVEPRMVEAYIALWKQYRKPEELVDPLEEATLRLERLKIRIEGLEKQIMHLEVIEKQQLDVYDAEIEELRARLEAKIAAAKEEFAAYADKTISEIEARILYYESLIPAATGLTQLRYMASVEMLKAIAVARVEEREAKLKALIEKWTKETEAKIKVIEERKEKYKAEMDERLDRLRTKLEEYELEKTATERVIERLKARV